MKRFLKKVIRNTGLEVSSWKNIKPSRQFLVDLIKQRVYKTSLKSPIAKENNLQSSKEKYRIIFDASSFFLEESNFSSIKRTINEAYKEYQKKHFDEAINLCADALVKINIAKNTIEKGVNIEFNRNRLTEFTFYAHSIMGYSYSDSGKESKAHKILSESICINIEDCSFYFSFGRNDYLPYFNVRNNQYKQKILEKKFIEKESNYLSLIKRVREKKDLLNIKILTIGRIPIKKEWISSLPEYIKITQKHTIRTGLNSLRREDNSLVIVDSLTLYSSKTLFKTIVSNQEIPLICFIKTFKEKKDLYKKLNNKNAQFIKIFRDAKDFRDVISNCLINEIDKLIDAYRISDEEYLEELLVEDIAKKFYVTYPNHYKETIINAGYKGLTIAKEHFLNAPKSERYKFSTYAFYYTKKEIIKEIIRYERVTSRITSSIR